MNRIGLTVCVALGTAGVAVAVSTAARAGAKAHNFTNTKNLVVTLVTPTNNQEVLPDLTDPGLNGVITVRFSSPVNVRDIIDDQNVVNLLTPQVEFLDSTFLRLPGNPVVQRNTFIFQPLSAVTPVLPNGQYTLNIKSSVRNTRGRMLNQGVSDYSSTFSVGTDTYPPVLRKISPIDGQQGIGLFQQIVATFNEPIDPSSIISTVLVQDASTNPPTPIPGKGIANGLAVTRNGFDITFTPDPCFGYPPKTTIQFIIQGNNPAGTPPGSVSSTVRDAFQNRFTRDPGLEWTPHPTIPDFFNSPNGSYDARTGQFRMQFQTKGIVPAPAAAPPGGAMMQPPLACVRAQGSILFYASPGCFGVGDRIDYTTDAGWGLANLRNFVTTLNLGVTDFTKIANLANTPVKLGQMSGAIFDPRIITAATGPNAPFTFQTFIYVVDQRTATVAVLRSDNLKPVGRLTGFSNPRDVALTTNTSQSRTTLYVSDFAANQVVAVDLQGIAVSFAGQPGAATPCDVVRDNQKSRSVIQVGLGPTEVAADAHLNQRLMVCNTIENSVSIINVLNNQVLRTYDVGGSPVGCAWNSVNFGLRRCAVIANQGGLDDPHGSLSMYIFEPVGFNAFRQTRDQIEGALTEGIRNPTHVFGFVSWHLPPLPVIGDFVNPGSLSSYPIHWLVSNTGGDSVCEVQVSNTGGFGNQLLAAIITTTHVGLNPTSCVSDNWMGGGASGGQFEYSFASVAGTGSIACFQTGQAIPATSILIPGVRRLFTPYTN